MKKIMLLAILFIFAIGGCYAMIETLNPEDMILKSDLIIVGKVVAIKATTVIHTFDDNFPTPKPLLNTLQVEETIAGIPQKTVKVYTEDGFEDDIDFRVNQKYLLYLKRSGDNYIVFNSPQGGLLLDKNEQLIGMIKDGVYLKTIRNYIKIIIQTHQK